MKSIILTPREYMTNFIKIAKFSFLTEIHDGEVYITANLYDLQLLGY